MHPEKAVKYNTVNIEQNLELQRQKTKQKLKPRNMFAGMQLSLFSTSTLSLIAAYGLNDPSLYFLSPLSFAMWVKPIIIARNRLSIIDKKLAYLRG